MLKKIFYDLFQTGYKNQNDWTKSEDKIPGWPRGPERDRGFNYAGIFNS